MAQLLRDELEPLLKGRQDIALTLRGGDMVSLTLPAPATAPSAR
jgi:hypothetical protein